MDIINKAVEIIARGKVFKRHITVSRKRAPLYVSPDSQLRYLKPGRASFDQDLIRIAERFLKDDSVVWDVGANIGVFTFASAVIARKGTVLAVEADGWLASILRRSARLSAYRDHDVRILAAAVSKNDGVATFCVAQRGRASNALECAGGRSTMGGVREKHYVPTLSLDTIRQTMPRPTFVKIDVEGAELMVLEGARGVLRDLHPVVYIEVGPELSSAVMKLFMEYDYVAVSPQGGFLETHCEANTLFIHREDNDALRLAGVQP